MTLPRTLGTFVESRTARLLSTFVTCVAVLSYTVPGLSDTSAVTRRLIVILASVVGWIVFRALWEQRQSAERAAKEQAVVFWDGPDPIDPMTRVAIHYLVRRGAFEAGGQTIDRQGLDAMLARHGLTQKDVEDMHAAAGTTSASNH